MVLQHNSLLKASRRNRKSTPLRDLQRLGERLRKTGGIVKPDVETAKRLGQLHKKRC
jgi:hypothetical protein